MKSSETGRSQTSFEKTTKKALGESASKCANQIRSFKLAAVGLGCSPISQCGHVMSHAAPPRGGGCGEARIRSGRSEGATLLPVNTAGDGRHISEARQLYLDQLNVPPPTPPSLKVQHFKGKTKCRKNKENAQTEVK